MADSEGRTAQSQRKSQQMCASGITAADSEDKQTEAVTHGNPHEQVGKQFAAQPQKQGVQTADRRAQGKSFQQRKGFLTGGYPRSRFSHPPEKAFS